MLKRLLYIFLGIVVMHCRASAQDLPVNAHDTFFLAKKKGLLGKIGKSISSFTPEEPPEKLENQFLKYKGKIIRSVSVISLGFECSIYDTCEITNNFGIRMANAFHKNTRERIMRNNLFFTEGAHLSPYLVADNERYIRTLPYIQDARIVVDYAESSKDSVDVVVLSKDIFSLGAKIKIATRTRGRLEIQEENLGGSATRVFVSGLYDEERAPRKAYNAEITTRNIAGSFIDWTVGYNSFGESFSAGKRDETSLYSRIEKPLVTPYVPSTGSLEAGFYQTSNAYFTDRDSLYKSDFRYKYYNFDGWLGYSLDSKRRIYANKEIKLHKFVAIRGMYQHFIDVPAKSKDTFDYRYTNTTGVLGSINIFKQSFYKTNFIYGFGRNEDVPEGFSLSITGGYGVRQNQGYVQKQKIRSPYAGLDFGLSNFRSRGSYRNITFRIGGFFYRNGYQDMNILLNVEHFSRLKKINSKWFHRTFLNTGVAAQINPVFTSPLFINSYYGLPYFNPKDISSDFRTTVKVETVYYNTSKVLGFRLAPFAFTDIVMLKPSNELLHKSDIFGSVGGGVRARNENLVFGTIELKGYWFPRTNGDMRSWKIDLSTNIRFKYNSTFIKRPAFANANL